MIGEQRLKFSETDFWRSKVSRNVNRSYELHFYGVELNWIVISSGRMKNRGGESREKKKADS